MSNKTAMNSLSVVTRGIAKASRRCQDHRVALPRVLRKPVVLSCRGSLSALLRPLQARDASSVSKPTSGQRVTPLQRAPHGQCSQLGEDLLPLGCVFGVSDHARGAQRLEFLQALDGRRLRWCLRRRCRRRCGRGLGGCRLGNHVLERPAPNVPGGLPR
jgi:hypothetical protein